MITTRTIQQQSRATYGVKLLQPNCCQKQDRARGEHCTNVRFSDRILYFLFCFQALDLFFSHIFSELQTSSSNFFPLLIVFTHLSLTTGLHFITMCQIVILLLCFGKAKSAVICHYKKSRLTWDHNKNTKQNTGAILQCNHFHGCVLQVKSKQYICAIKRLLMIREQGLYLRKKRE